MGKWYCNLREDDEIWYSDAFDDRDEVIEYGVQEYKDALRGIGTDLFDDCYPDEPTGIFYIAEGIEFKPHIDVERIIESAGEEAYDTCGEVGFDYLDWQYINKYIPELRDELQAVFDKWLDKYQSEIYYFENIEEIDANDYL